VGGLLGAKLLYVFEHLDDGSFLSLFLDRGGMSWFGGFAGGLLAGYLTIRAKRWPTLAVLAAATPALAVGQMLGRVGGFLVGADYGSPTTPPWGGARPAAPPALPWVAAFPQGRRPPSDRVHAPRLYEAVFLAVLAWALIRWRRAGV